MKLSAGHMSITSGMGVPICACANVDIRYRRVCLSSAHVQMLITSYSVNHNFSEWLQEIER